MRARRLVPLAAQHRASCASDHGRGARRRDADLRRRHRQALPAGPTRPALSHPRLRRGRVHVPGLVPRRRRAPGPAPSRRRPARGQRQGRAPVPRRTDDGAPGLLPARGPGRRDPELRGDLPGERRPARPHRAQARAGSAGAGARATRVAGSGLDHPPALARLACGARSHACAGDRRRPGARRPGPAPARLRRALRAPAGIGAAQGRAEGGAGASDRFERAGGRTRTRPALPPHRGPGAQPGRDSRRPCRGPADVAAAAGRRRRRQDRGRHAGHGRCGRGGTAVGADGAHRNPGAPAFRDHRRAARGPGDQGRAADRPRPRRATR